MPDDEGLAPPISREAEDAVLGAILIDPDAIGRVAAILKQPEDFYYETHQEIYRTCLALHEQQQPCDFVLLVDELERRGTLDMIGGSARLTKLLNYTPTAAYAEHYAEQVKEMARLRRVIAVAENMVRKAYAREPSGEVLGFAEQGILALSQDARKGQGPRKFGQVLSGVVDRIQEVQTARESGKLIGVPTGFQTLDTKLGGGMQENDLLVLAARPGVGKTALAMNIGAGAAIGTGKYVLIFSLEMSAEQLVTRHLATSTGINQVKLRMGDLDDNGWTQIMQASGPLGDLPILIDDVPGRTPLEIRSIARQVASREGLCLVIVDYIQLMRTDRREQNRVLEIGQFTSGLKGLARELHIPVLALSQMSRAIEQREDHKPVLSDLREGGSIENDADVVMFIWREELVKADTERKNIADIIFGKHRNGPTDPPLGLYFDPSLTRYADLEVVKPSDDGDTGAETRASASKPPARTRATGRGLRGSRDAQAALAMEHTHDDSTADDTDSEGYV